MQPAGMLKGPLGLTLLAVLCIAATPAVEAQRAQACDVCICFEWLDLVDCGFRGLTRFPVFPNTTRIIIFERNSIFPTRAELAETPLLEEIDFSGVRDRAVERTGLPSALFADLPHFRTLYFKDIRAFRVSFSGDVFIGAVHLEHLVFGMQRAETVSGMFVHLTGLKNLTITETTSTTLPGDLLATQHNLLFFSLTASNLETLPVSLFQPTQKLQELRMFRLDALTSLPAGLLPHSLETFEFSYCKQLTELPKGLFADLPSLKSLQVNYGGFTDLHNGTFVNLPNLTSLLSEHGSLERIHSGTFQHLPRLSTVSLFGNALQALPSDLGSSIPSIASLYLGHNLPFGGHPLHQVNPFWKQMPNLTLLDLSACQFHEVTQCGGLQKLKILRINGNVLSRVPSCINELSNLEQLALSENELTALHANDLQGLSKLVDLTLANNEITHIDPTALHPLKGVEKISISLEITDLPPNLFEGLTNLRVVSLAGSFTALHSGQFRTNHRLEDLEYLRRHADGLGLQSIPEDLFEHNPNLLNLALSAHNLGAIPAELFRTTPRLTSLVMRNCRVTHLPGSLLQGLFELQQVDLMTNNLTRLESRLFTGLPSLLRIALIDNNISVVKHGAFPSVGLADQQGDTTRVVSMEGSPTICSFPVSEAKSLAIGKCRCAEGTLHGGSFCEDPSEVTCINGTTDHDHNPDTPCLVCQPGSFAPFDAKGACQSCPAGTSDSDSNPSTPCVPCTTPGYYVPAGSTGACTASPFDCSIEGRIDHDADSSTPCKDLCDACSCSGTFIDCRDRNLTAIPKAPPLATLFGTAFLDISDNPISEFSLDSLRTWPLLKTLALLNGQVTAVTQEQLSYLSAQLNVLVADGNPSSCSYKRGEVDISCLCAPGFTGSGPCTATTTEDRVECPPGFVDHDTAAETPCVQCSAPGLYVPKGSLGSCSQYVCPLGSTDHDLDSSTPCMECEPGTYVPRGSVGTCYSLRTPAGTIDHDGNPETAEQSCPVGHFLPAGSFGKCKAFFCAEGTIDHDSNPATPCVTCPTGHFVPHTQTGSCRPFKCHAGEVDQDSNPATRCATLTPGYYSQAGAFGFVSTFQCPGGTVDDDHDSSTACTACDAGHFVPPGSAGACSDYACVEPFADLDDDPTTPCGLRPATAAAGAGALSDDQTAGIVVCILLVAVILAVLVVLRLRKLKAQPHDFSSEVQALGLGGTTKVPRELDNKRLRLLEQLGAGAFGTVYKGVLDESTTLGLPSYLVAVKSFPEPSAKECQMIFQEAVLMAQIDSDYVVGLVGVISDRQPISIVLQFCEHGALITFLRKRGATLLLNSKVQIAHDIATGMSHIVEAGFVHRDLAARNVLIDSALRAKVADFGHAREVGAGYYKSKGGEVAVRWAAPEALCYEQYNEATDVWSFGITLFEIFSNGELPYKAMPNEDVWAKVSEGVTPGFPEKCPEAIEAIMLQCWMKAKMRPTFKELRTDFVQVLDGAENSLSKEILGQKSNRTVENHSACSGYWSSGSVGQSKKTYVQNGALSTNSGYWSANSANKPQPQPTSRPSSRTSADPLASQVPNTYTRLTDVNSPPQDRAEQATRRASLASNGYLTMSPSRPPKSFEEKDELLENARISTV